uniref:Uncharacterized protein n=1 Tax=Acrobeloides nanus TaxID=290746 RepID=A0A914CQF5_9BILA
MGQKQSNDSYERRNKRREEKHPDTPVVPDYTYLYTSSPGGGIRTCMTPAIPSGIHVSSGGFGRCGFGHSHDDKGGCVHSHHF